MKKLLVAIVLGGFVSSCGIGNSIGGSAGSSTSASSAGSGSSAGGSSLFGRRNTSKQAVDPIIAPDGRTLIAVVKEARFDRTRDGAIVRARGIAPRQGYHKASLVSPTNFLPDQNGVITLEFRAQEPKFRTNALTERSREIDVGVFVSSQKLANAKSIRIVGRDNQIGLRK